MSFFNNIKKIFGIGGDDTVDELETPQGVIAQQSDTSDRSAAIDVSLPVEVSAEVRQSIFAGVVQVFNTALPDFLAKSVDAEKQQKLLYDALDDSIKQYITQLELAAQARCEAAWESERAKQQQETQSLKQRTKELEQKRAEIKEKQLSAERQKRALSERIHDLENQVLNLEGEKEQYELERKSMINKTKVVQVYEQEIEQLKADLDALRHNPPASVQADPNIQVDETLKNEVDDLHRQNEDLGAEIVLLNETISGLNETITALNTDKEQLSSLLSDLNNQNTALSEENQRLMQDCEKAKLKDKMGGAMFNDMQSKVSEALKQSKVSEEKIDQLETNNAQLRQKVEELEKTLGEKDIIINENEAAIAQIEEIMNQVQQFESVKAKLEARIARLTTDLTEARQEAESLRTTIKDNMYLQVTQEQAMKEEIENLRTVRADTNTIANETRQTNVEKSRMFQYPTLFETIGDTGVIKDEPEDSPHTDDLIADTDWIKG